MSKEYIYDFTLERYSSYDELLPKIDIILDDLRSGKLDGVASLILDATEIKLRYDSHLYKYIGSYDWGVDSLSQVMDRESASKLLYHIIRTTEDIPYDLRRKEIAALTVRGKRFY